MQLGLDEARRSFAEYEHHLEHQDEKLGNLLGFSIAVLALAIAGDLPVVLAIAVSFACGLAAMTAWRGYRLVRIARTQWGPEVLKTDPCAIGDTVRKMILDLDQETRNLQVRVRSKARAIRWSARLLLAAAAFLVLAALWSPILEPSLRWVSSSLRER